MKRILALDMGSQCGWAFQSTTGAIQSGVTPFLSSTKPGDRWIRFCGWLETWWDMDPEFVVYETPFVHFKHRGGLGVSYGFEAMLHLYTARREIRCLGITPSLLKQFATGRGNASKDQMLTFARSMGWKMQDNNEVDARWLLEYARVRLAKFKGAA